ncbi:hypothetical protein MHZ95_10545 [Sporosarcina sp. ACRSM]|uniref:exosporium glycoprotein BclB-related protein n=1 Tax=Sporosarcina sp. ACRSM TaxID=2918216 RepID=UPI001EF3E8A2|nr:exosporium glycoprotein BclB-related protein [Sporosarcina sp. ACRSM]MCG7335717.1 hypothetical protein [Sporosarcina sp. ACRSM]
MSNYYGCNRCGGRGRCQNDINCGNGSSNNNRCGQLGPFVAVDPACVVTPAPRSVGAMIPFASGLTPLPLTAVVGGALVGTTTALGFGSFVPGLTIVGTGIDLSGVFNEAFSAARPGVLTAISATFSVTTGLTLALGGSVSIRAEVYRAPEGSTDFVATGVAVNLTPALSGVLTTGQTVSGTATGFNFPVALGDRLLLVLSTTTTGLAIADVIVGTAGAGITIE